MHQQKFELPQAYGTSTPQYCRVSPHTNNYEPILGKQGLPATILERHLVFDDQKRFLLLLWHIMSPMLPGSSPPLPKPP